jgi:hypothetical protein
MVDRRGAAVGSRSIIAMAILTLAAGTGCGTEPREPDVPQGTWMATTFTLSGAVTGNVLAEGGELRLTLNADGTMSGRLFVPASLGGGEEGEDFDRDMAGTWALADGILTFEQAEDTFVRDLEWTWSGNTLSASGTFSDVTISVVLTRSG